MVGAGVEKRGMFMGTGLVGQQQCQCHPHTNTPTPKPRSHFLLIGEKQSEVEIQKKSGTRFPKIHPPSDFPRSRALTVKILHSMG